MARWFPKMIECTILQQIEVRINLCEKNQKTKNVLHVVKIDTFYKNPCNCSVFEKKIEGKVDFCIF